MVQRIVYQQWENYDCSNTGTGQAPDISGDAFKQLLKAGTAYASGGKRAFVYGSENKKMRKTRMVPASYVVTQVEKKSSATYQIEGFAECYFTTLEMTYTWGPYRQTINVHEGSENRANGQVFRHEKNYVEPRHKMGEDYFPSE